MAETAKVFHAEHEMQYQDFIVFVRWVAERSRKELEELDKYTAEKIQEMVRRFQTIAETVSEQKKSVRQVRNPSEMVTVKGKMLSYSEAVRELNKLTTSLTTGSVLTDEQFLMRRKIAVLTKAIEGYAERQEHLTETTEHSTQDISSHVRDIIIAFQFQDFVKQRLDHINMVFDNIIKEADNIFADGKDQTVPDTMALRLLDRFFLSRVKENFMDGLDPKQAANMGVVIEEDDDDDGIELF